MANGKKHARRFERAMQNHIGKTYMVSYRNSLDGLIGRLVSADIAYHTFVDTIGVAEGARHPNDAAAVLVPTDIIESLALMDPPVVIANPKPASSS